MEIYYFGTNGEKVGPITKEGLSRLIESGIIIESTKLVVNGKEYVAGQIPTIAQLIEKRMSPNKSQKVSTKDLPPPPMPGDKRTSKSYRQGSERNSDKNTPVNTIDPVYAKFWDFSPISNSRYINTDNPVYAKFWKYLNISNCILKLIYTLSLIVSASMFCLRLYQATNEYSVIEDIDITVWLLAIAIIAIAATSSFLIISFMASIVHSAEQNHKTMILLEEALKSKNNQEDKGAGGIL